VRRPDSSIIIDKWAWPRGNTGTDLHQQHHTAAHQTHIFIGKKRK